MSARTSTHTTMRTTTPWVRLVAGVCFGLLSACSDAEFGELEVELLSSPPLPVDAKSSRVKIPIGIAAELRILPVSKTSQDYSALDKLRLTTSNEAVLAVRQVYQSNEVVIAGVRPGDTCIRVIVNDEQVTCLPVSVIDQEEE
jgi:hypothetical protein